MSNFIETYKQGKKGDNTGLDTGIPALNRAINRFKKGVIIGVAAAPKCGKTALVDYSFVISPYLEAVRLGTVQDLHIIYYSFEITRVKKEFKYAAFFMYHDYGIMSFMYKGKEINMCADYLLGQMIIELPDGKEELVKVLPEHEELLKQIYQNRIIPLFGEFDKNNIQIKKGVIDFIQTPENPTGIYKHIKAFAKTVGTFVEEAYYVKDENGVNVRRTKLVDYKTHNPKLRVTIITDHVRKLRKERGFNVKETIDKFSDYAVEIRDLCLFSFIYIIHSNRNLANPDRLRTAGEWIYPTADDTKDSGNIAEDCNILMTLFNARDEKYNLKKHMGLELEDYPFYRSLHITESRDTECPVHLQLNMFGNVNYFSSIKI